ncbi:Putative SOS response-associated peptidase YedK [Kaistia soli DSM 19436]|uniref:Abasic site processing protein n=2 Tax=Kaistia TaxID=166953 RepID=A0A1M4VN16_9HYPH|nr:Putative SOS response-associated peptidase YedK [Kaistia soli DSM 19436]
MAMCGRYALAVTPEDLEQEFSLIRIEWFPPRYNIAPTQPIHVIRAEKGARALGLVRWGLVPSWAKNPADLPLFFNARSETAPEKPAFRGPFRHRRCLVPATGFYEWKREGGRKQPFLVRSPERRIIAFAGLWDEYADANGNLLDSATILTTAANEDLSSIHDRMPVVIEPADYDRWLGLVPAGKEELVAALVPARPGFFETVAVDTRVNSARDDDAGLQAPLAESPPQAPPKTRTPRAAAGAGEPAAPDDDRQMKLF